MEVRVMHRGHWGDIDWLRQVYQHGGQRLIRFLVFKDEKSQDILVLASGHHEASSHYDVRKAVLAAERSWSCLGGGYHSCGEPYWSSGSIRENGFPDRPAEKADQNRLLVLITAELKRLGFEKEDQ